MTKNLLSNSHPNEDSITMKKPLGIILLTVLILSSCAILKLTSADPLPGPPISNAYIHSDGSVDPSNLPIQKSGNTYTFTNSIANYTLEIQCSNITIDGAGFTLLGNGIYWYQAITVTDQNNITVKNLSISQFGWGIYLSNSDGDTISGNTITCSNCIYIDPSSEDQIIGNNLSTGYGVQGLGSWNQIINNAFNSELSGPGQGAGIEMGCNNTLISNNVFNDEDSIQLGSSYSVENNVISNNTLTNGVFGINLDACNCTICQNIIENKVFNEQSGEDGGGGSINLGSGSFYNSIYDNLFENDSYGISLGYQIVNNFWNNVSSNYIYANNFINNTRNADVVQGTPVNFWDNGSQGNYWSDYKGTDANHDGVGDIPYVLNGNNTDYYPSMDPINIYASQSPPVPTPPPTSEPTATPAQTATKTTQPTATSASTRTIAPTQISQTPTNLPAQQTSSDYTLITVVSTVAIVGVCTGLFLFYRRSNLARY